MSRVTGAGVGAEELRARLDAVEQRRQRNQMSARRIAAPALNRCERPFVRRRSRLRLPTAFAAASARSGTRNVEESAREIESGGASRLLLQNFAALAPMPVSDD
jgi:hypothetical protein